MSIQTTIALHAVDAAILRGHVVQCTRRAFAAYAIQVDLDEGDPCELAHDDQIVAFIGFGGARVRGTLTVMAPQMLWLKTYPVAHPLGARPGDNDLLDWCAEVVNQILGRIKNQLVRRGVDLQVSMPKALHASQLSISRSAQKTVCMLRSSSGEASLVGVWLDALVGENGILFPALSEALPPASVDEPMSEGDIVLF
jgi:hypothetical protein